jgi:hypothetical protein
MRNKRLEEKLKAIASKRGPDSPQAEELARQLAAGAPAEAPKGDTEKPKKQESK